MLPSADAVLMEPVLTNALATVTMALLTSVAALFSEGVAQYRAEHYEQAVASFTKVVDTAEFKHSFTEPALLFRAQAYVKLGKKDLGVKDLDRLLTAFPGSPFREVAASEYKGLTGEPWRGLDLSTPEAA